METGGYYIQQNYIPTTTAHDTTTEDNKSQKSAMTAQSSTLQTSTITVPPKFDYKAELECINQEIKTKLKKQFEDLFMLMDKKID